MKRKKERKLHKDKIELPSNSLKKFKLNFKDSKINRVLGLYKGSILISEIQTLSLWFIFKS